MKVAIIGGGIGGLSAALQLSRFGIDVHVYEQASQMRQIGAGIRISPNASRLLLRLGLMVPADAVGLCRAPLSFDAGKMRASCSARRLDLKSSRPSARRRY
jgi:2-polyprenyl-6-methoxyphenol hydroxylase-like FAD-dependent oxidoreductase